MGLREQLQAQVNAGDISQDEMNFNLGISTAPPEKSSGDIIDSIKGFAENTASSVEDTVSDIGGFIKDKFNEPSPQERINRDALNYDKRQFDKSREHGFERALKAGLPIKEDFISKVQNSQLPIDEFATMSDKDKKEFQKYAAEKDRGILPALGHGFRDNVTGKILRGTGLLQDHPSGYRYQPQNEEEEIAHSITGILGDAGIFGGGAALGGLIGGAAGGAGYAFGTHRALDTLMDHINDGPTPELGDDMLSGFSKGFVTGGLTHGIGLGTKLGTNKVAGKIFNKSINRLIKNKQANAEEITEKLVTRLAKAENVANTAIGIPAEGAGFTAAGVALDGEEFSTANLAKNITTIALLRGLHSKKASKKILQNVSRKKGFSEKKIAENMIITEPELETLFKDNKALKRYIENAADNAEIVDRKLKLDKNKIVNDDIISRIKDDKAVEKRVIEADEEARPFVKNVPEKLAPVEGEAFTKTEKQLLSDIRKINPEGVKIFREVNKENFKKVPEVNEKIEFAVEELMDRVNRHPDPQSLYNDISLLDIGTPAYLSLKPLHAKEALRRVQSSLAKEHDANYIDVLREMKEREQDIFRNVETEYKLHDNPPEWGAFSKSRVELERERISYERVKQSEKKSETLLELVDIEKKRNEIIDAESSPIDKDRQLRVLEDREFQLLGRPLVSKAGAIRVQESFSKDPNVVKEANNYIEGGMKAPEGLSFIKDALQEAESIFITGRGKMVAKQTKAGAIIYNRIKEMRRLKENLNANWQQDYMNMIKHHDKPTIQLAHRYLDLGDARYRAEVGTPNRTTLVLADRINSINKAVALRLKQAGLSIEELDTYFQRRWKPEFLEGGKNEAEFLEWVGENLKERFPRANIKTLTPEARREANIERGRAEIFKLRQEELGSNLKDTERLSSFQISRKFPNAPEKFYQTEKPSEITLDYLEQASEAIAMRDMFGPNQQHLANLVGKGVNESNIKFGVGSAMAKKIQKNLFDLTDTVAHRSRPNDQAMDRIAQKVVNFEILTKMPLSQLGQFAQTMEGWIHGTTKSYLKALKTIGGMNSEMSSEEAREFAFRTTDSMRVAHKSILRNLYGDSELGSKMLRRTGFNFADASSRYVSLVTGMFHADDLVSRLNKYDMKTISHGEGLDKAGGWGKYRKKLKADGIKLTPKEMKDTHMARMVINRMKRLNMAPRDLQRGKDGKHILTTQHKHQMAREFEVNTNYRAHWEDLPRIFAGGKYNGLKRMITQFKSFGYEKTKHTLKDVLYQEAKMGNFLPIIKATAAAGIGGAPILALRSFLSGRDLPEEKKDFILKAMSTAGALGTLEIPHGLWKYNDTQFPGAGMGDILDTALGIVNVVKRDEYRVAGVAELLSRFVPVQGRHIEELIQKEVEKRKKNRKKFTGDVYKNLFDTELEEVKEAEKTARDIMKDLNKINENSPKEWYDY